MAPKFKRDRRLDDETFRRFCDFIDLWDRSKCTRELFSCSRCELQLNKNDCRQLGLNEEHCDGYKRFRSVVMDGKIIGVLRDFPVHNDIVQTLVDTKGLPKKLVRNRKAHSVLRDFMKSVPSMIRAVEYGRGEQVNGNIAVKNGKVHLRRGSMI